VRKNFGTNMKSVLLVFVAFENNFPNLKGKKENVCHWIKKKTVSL